MSRQKHYDAVAQIGCLACLKDGVPNVPACLHHPYGRKRGHDREVIPLCYGHHQSGNHELPLSVHGNKKEFVEMYGTEAELLFEVMEIVNGDRGGVKQSNG